MIRYFFRPIPFFPRKNFENDYLRRNLPTKSSSSPIFSQGKVADSRATSRRNSNLRPRLNAGLNNESILIKLKFSSQARHQALSPLRACLFVIPRSSEAKFRAMEPQTSVPRQISRQRERERKRARKNSCRKIVRSDALVRIHTNYHGKLIYPGGDNG